ncbi:MAG: hypothetical protein KatS3mg096_104 [Candidatus Parcubacteria bacterium]|nr:MAG: hypothetical protein KatS3mg096_104 [Candidatus Parcubacteria bacterium]
MIGKILKWIFYLIVILIVFAILPKNILAKIKQFVNWDIFFNTLKTGWQNLVSFLQQVTGIDFSQIPIKLKEKFGIDIVLFWTTIKNFLANLFEKLAKIFR